MNIGCSPPVTPQKSRIPRVPKTSRIPQTPPSPCPLNSSLELEEDYNNITTSTPEPSSDISIFDHIWSLTTNEETIPVHDLFRLLKYLEIELMSSTTIDPYFLTNDFIIKSRIVEQSEFLERVDKQQAFNIICHSLKDIQFLDPNNPTTTATTTTRGRSRTRRNGDVIDPPMSDSISEENDYDETATLMEMNQNSPLREDTENMNQRDMIFNWTKPTLRVALKELELLHTKLDKQYNLLETELAEIKRKNSSDLEELKSLSKSNDNIYDRIENIRDELLNFNDELVNYRDKFHSNRTINIKDDKQVLTFLTDNDDELVLQELTKPEVQEDLNWSTETTPIVEQIASNIKDEVRLLDSEEEKIPTMDKRQDDELENIDNDVTVEGAQTVNIDGIDKVVNLDNANTVNPNIIMFIIIVLFLYTLF